MRLTLNPNQDRSSPAPAGRPKIAQYVRRRRASSRGGVGKCWVGMARIQFRSAEGQCAAERSTLRYRRLRAVGQRLNSRISGTVPREAFYAIGGAIGILRNGTLELREMPEPNFNFTTNEAFSLLSS